jgi:hypothetical protein
MLGSGISAKNDAMIMKITFVQKQLQPHIRTDKRCFVHPGALRALTQVTQSGGVVTAPQSQWAADDGILIELDARGPSAHGNSLRTTHANYYKIDISEISLKHGSIGLNLLHSGAIV